jgi:hypothetical protein
MRLAANEYFKDEIRGLFTVKHKAISFAKNLRVSSKFIEIRRYRDGENNGFNVVDWSKEL